MINKFCVSSVNVKSSWFDSGDNVFKRMGKDKGLNLYLQLFRFRVHQGSYDEHIFYTSLSHLRKLTGINRKNTLRFSGLRDLMMDMVNSGVISVVSGDIKNAEFNDLLVIKASDVPRIASESFININLDSVNYMYDELALSSKHMSLYTTLVKLESESDSGVVSIRINDIREVLGSSNKWVTDSIALFNKLGIMQTEVIKYGYREKFEHIICKDLSRIEDFKMVTQSMREEFIKRYE